MRLCSKFLWMLLAAVMLAGCGLSGTSDDRDERDPYLRKARELKNLQDYEGAIALYNKALERKPGLARAHLELGLIYDQQLNDDVRAIYHYERYLEMRPDAEKKQIVEELIRHAKISFAGTLPNRPAEAVREIDMLKREVATLRQLLAEKSGVTNVPASASAGQPSAQASASPATAAAPAASAPASKATSETYTVKPGDTLARIATKVYNDSSRWKEIYEANRAKLPSPQSLKAGQVLVIPR